MNDQDTWLREMVNEATPHPPRAVDFDQVAARVAVNRSTPRARRVALVLAASGIVALAAFGIAAVEQHSRPYTSALPHGSLTPRSSASVVSQRPRVTTKEITYRGVRVAIPSTWPIIDGAHFFHGCSSLFAGQSEQAYLGPTYSGWPGCPISNKPTPPANGLWMQPGGSTPRGETLGTLPNGQHAYVSGVVQSAVTVWFHHVLMNIGIGANRNIERAIIASIAYLPQTPNTSVRGQCPAPNPIPLAMPHPTRVRTPRSIPGDEGHLFPEPSSVGPKVSAAAVWRNYVGQSGGGPRGPITWSITFGRYTAHTTTEVTRNGTTKLVYGNVPTWLIEGIPAHTTLGDCAETLVAMYNANTGRATVFTATG